jgi:3',5'-cyclic-AMP phosphodiesterase
MTNNAACISILQLSDLHILRTPEDKLLGVNTEHYFHACLEQALAEKQHFDLILLTGDLAQDPCPESYRRILTSLEVYEIPCICLPGNHDDDELMRQVLNTDRVNCCKQVKLDNWQLISLNSRIPGKPGGRLSKEELAFLETCLTENPDRHALIAVHHHFLATKSPWMDTMMIENSRDFLALLNKYPQVKVITNGHIHQVMDVKTAAFRVLGAPSTCFQFTPETPEFSISDTAPGYRLIELYTDGRVESEVVRLPERLTGLQASEEGY